MTRRPVDDLWPRLLDWRHLHEAMERASRGKRRRPDVASFWFDQESELLRLHDELADGSYRPGAFRSHWIARPKRRLISAAPFRDRIVHHAVMMLLEPILEMRFHRDSYACRPGKGSHAAARRLQHWMRRRRWVLQCDIRRFFPSIDHMVLKSLFRTRVADARLLGLMDLIVDSSNEQEPVLTWFPGDRLWTPLERRRGLPIGNLTSQWFANWILDDLDHFVTSTLGFGGYVRYCDDFIVLGDDRRELVDAASRIESFLAARRLELHRGKLAVRSVEQGVTFVGFRLWPHRTRLRRCWLTAYRRRIRWLTSGYAEGRLEWEDVRQRLAGLGGHASFAGDGVIRSLAVDWRFSRARAVTTACCGAAAGTTTPGTAARRTATTTRRAIGTTTTGSVSPCTSDAGLPRPPGS